MRARAQGVVIVAFLVALRPASSFAQVPETRTAGDSVLAARVAMALEGASDLPADSLSVSAVDGIVIVSGSVMCGDCGGTRTPGGTGTVQQTLGAIVRAVPGVEGVRFDLRYRPR